MTEATFHPSVIIFVIGSLVVLAILLKAGLKRIGLPALVGYLVLGFLLRLADVQWGMLSEQDLEVFEILTKIGVIALLFRIGLESNLQGLIQQLRRASLVWVFDVSFSGGLGYLISYFLLGLGLIPSLFVATALMATSVGISVGVWHEADALNSPNGELLLDVAELDDISSIIFMAVLFAIVPVLQQGSAQESVGLILAKSIGIIVIKLVLFGAFCVFFSLYIESHVTGFFKKIQTPAEPMLMVVSLGVMLGALAALLGFSVAIGAFFAGLIFSRDPDSVNIDASFNALYELFSPFFFIGIGLNIDPESLLAGLGIGGMLFLIAIVGKTVGVGTIVRVMTNCWSGAALLGVSMIPRAEIAMIVMQQGVQKGDWAVPSEVYAGMVLVTAATCLFAPIVIRALLQKWPQAVEQGDRA